jgi:hypothetical protein
MREKISANTVVVGKKHKRREHPRHPRMDRRRVLNGSQRNNA